MARRDLTFRVFVSSTFSDLIAERNALQERTFPRLRTYCQEKGAQFQAIDLRWGVSEEAALDQQTMNICLQELKRCQKVSPRPNFIVLLGDRYGWQPLPPQIDAEEFERFRGAMTLEEQATVSKWYRRDDNAVPSKYVLQSRTGEFEDLRRWDKEEAFLHDILLRTAHNVFPPNDEALNKYQDSATHQEIRHGALQAEDPQTHVFAYFRTIEGLPEDSSAKDYRDIKDGTIDREAQDRLLTLKWKLQSLLPPAHAYEYRAEWHEGRPLSDLQVLCERVEGDLRAIIDSELAAFQQASELDREIEAHKEFGKDRTEHFIGRGEILRKIQTYLVGDSNRPLVISGVSGSGKTALMAKGTEAIADCGMRNAESAVISRFIGATPASSDIRSLLESLCRQIARAYGDERPVQGDYRELLQDFPKRLALAIAERPMVVLLDALDQLSPTDGARYLGWLPRELPVHVKLIVSVLESDGAEGDCYRIVNKLVPAENLARIEALPTQQGEKLLDAWLEQTHRRLQPEQRHEILSKFAVKGLPLYLKLAFGEARRWKSYDPTPPLGADVLGVVTDMLARLEDERNHGHMLTSRALGYLAAGRHGLTEEELLDILSLDEEVLSDFRKRSPRSPEADRLPVVIWSRLHADLEPYLTERRADNTTVLSFYHRQLGEVVVRRYLTDEEKVIVHRKLSRYFLSEADPTGDASWCSNYSRALIELPYHTFEAEDYFQSFLLAKDELFLSSQEKASRSDPKVPFQTIKLAIEAAGVLDDAGKMAEFILRHVWYVTKTTSESPLQALRAGNPERALSLANMFDIEKCILWHLLIAWELQNSGKLYEAQETVNRLKQFDLRELGYINGELARFLLGSSLLFLSGSIFSLLVEKLLHDNARRNLCYDLAEGGHIQEALKYAQMIGDQEARQGGLRDIVLASACRGHYQEAVAVAALIEQEWVRAEAAREIVKRVREKAAFTAALEITQTIEIPEFRNETLLEIGRAQTQAGQIEEANRTLAEALQSAWAIEKETPRRLALEEIARAQAQVGQPQETNRTFAEALESARTIGDAYFRAEALSELAKAQARVGQAEEANRIFAEALESAGAIEVERPRSLALWRIARAEAQGGQFDAVFKCAQMIEDAYFRAWALSELAKAQARVGQAEEANRTFAEALEAARTIETEVERLEAFMSIIRGQVEAAQLEQVALTLAAAFEPVRTTDIHREQAESFIEIAKEQIMGGQREKAANVLLSAMESAQKIQNKEHFNSLLRKIVLIQAQVGQFDAALKSAGMIESEADQAEALREIAKAQAQVGQLEEANRTFVEALESARAIEEETPRRLALEEIARAQAQVGQPEEANRTFAEALESARTIGDGYYRAEALSELAKGQAQVGQFDAALKSAGMIESEADQAEALRKIAKAQAQAGQMEQATCTIAAALKFARMIKSKFKRVASLCNLAETQVQAGQLEEANRTFAEALESARTIESEADQAEALREIAKAQAQVGQYNSALDSAQMIVSGYKRDKTLGEILEVQAGAGHLPEALGSARMIERLEQRAWTFVRIARAQARAGQLYQAVSSLTPALDCAQMIKNKEVPMEILLEIAKLQVQAGQLESMESALLQALKSALMIENEIIQVDCLEEIAEVWVKGGKYKAALGCVQKIKFEGARVRPLIMIAKAQAKAGQSKQATEIFETALMCANMSESESIRTEDLINIAEAQAEANLGKEAIKTSELIFSQRDFGLQRIAEALVKRGDKKSFKHIMAPCANYPNAAYRTCSLLGRLYPEQQAFVLSAILKGGV